MLPAGAQRRRGGGRAGRGARAHALRRQPRRLRRPAPDGDGRLHRHARRGASRARRAAGGELRRAARPVRQRAGDLPGVARPPVTRPARPRPLRRAAARTARRRRRLATARASTTAGRWWWPGWAPRRWTSCPVLQRVVTALGAAPVRGIVDAGRPPRPGRPRRARRACSSPATCATPRCSRGRPRWSPTPASAPCWPGSPTACRWCACRSGASSPPTPTPWRGSGAGVVLDPSSSPEVIAEAIARAVDRPRAARRRGADGGGDRRARAVGRRPCARSSGLL